MGPVNMHACMYDALAYVYRNGQRRTSAWMHARMARWILVPARMTFERCSVTVVCLHLVDGFFIAGVKTVYSPHRKKAN